MLPHRSVWWIPTTWWAEELASARAHGLIASDVALKVGAVERATR